MKTNRAASGSELTTEGRTTDFIYHKSDHTKEGKIGYLRTSMKTPPDPAKSLETNNYISINNHPMNKLQIIIIAIFGIALITSCNSDHESVNINLNNGEKWEVNAEMKPHIEKGKELVDAYNVQKDADYQKLAENLKAQNSELIQSCTMKGESHDELHNWLHPHMQLIDSLSKANSEEAAKEIVSEIDESFNTYQKYFE